MSRPPRTLGVESPTEAVSRTLRAFHGSILFIPTLMAIGAIGLSILTTIADGAFGVSGLPEGPLSGLLLFDGNADQASVLLSSIATTWATIAGVVFSVTLVTLQLAATKFSAQVIPSFERDRFNQVVLGAFVGTVVYALLILKTVPGDAAQAGAGPVPVIGVNVAMFLAVASIFLFIAFLGNLSSYMRPNRFVARLEGEVTAAERARHKSLERPGIRRADPPEGEAAWPPGGGAVPGAGTGGRAAGGAVLRAREKGYVSRVDLLRLGRAAARAARGDLDGVPVVRLLVQPGDEVGEGQVLAEVLGLGPADGGGEPEAALAKGLRRAFQLDDMPTTEGDAHYATQTLGDIAVTAMSGGSTDVGVSKTSLGALLRVMGDDLRRDPPPRRLVVTTEPDLALVVVSEPKTVWSTCQGEVARIVHKAAREGYADVLEHFALRSEGALRAAATSRDPEAWPRHLAWFAPLALIALAAEDLRARERIGAHLGAALRAMESDQEVARAGELEAALLEGARRGEAPEDAMRSFARAAAGVQGSEG